MKFFFVIFFSLTHLLCQPPARVLGFKGFIVVVIIIILLVCLCIQYNNLFQLSECSVSCKIVVTSTVNCNGVSCSKTGY